MKSTWTHSIVLATGFLIAAGVFAAVRAEEGDGKLEHLRSESAVTARAVVDEVRAAMQYGAPDIDDAVAWSRRANEAEAAAGAKTRLQAAKSHLEFARELEQAMKPTNEASITARVLRYHRLQAEIAVEVASKAGK